MVVFCIYCLYFLFYLIISMKNNPTRQTEKKVPKLRAFQLVWYKNRNQTIPDNQTNTHSHATHTIINFYLPPLFCKFVKAALCLSLVILYSKISCMPIWQYARNISAYFVQFILLNSVYNYGIIVL